MYASIPCSSFGLLQCANVSHTTDNPHEDPNIRGDAFKTLIAARLDYSVEEHDLEREFGRYGPIERVCNPALSLNPSEPKLTRTTDSHYQRHPCR